MGTNTKQLNEDEVKDTKKDNWGINPSTISVRETTQVKRVRNQGIPKVSGG